MRRILEYKFNMHGLRDVLKLTDNKTQAIGFQKSVEKKLKKDNNLDIYNKALKRAIDKGYIVKLGKSDIQEYSGPVSYVTHFPVYKPGSKSTPVRVVTNTSLKNRNCGLSPNECMAVPPKALSNLLQVLVRLQSYMKALCMDMSKAYQSVKTGDLEQNVRRLVWRWGDSTSDWTVYAWDVMTFGDQWASLILELTKKMAADIGRTTDFEAALVLALSTYVDDLLGGGSPEQAAPFKGNLLPDGSYSGSIPVMLSKVGLVPKILVESGESDPEILDEFGESVLGHIWCSETDQLLFKLPVNLSKKNRLGVWESPDLIINDMPCLPHMVFTKRRLLGWVMSLYDPIGLLSPLTIKYKIELRRPFSGEYGSLNWDDPVHGEIHKEWESLLSECLKIDEICVSQSVRPSSAVGDPELKLVPLFIFLVL